ncbi:MAG: peptidylprolyl isomerase [Phycisphaerales bacterium]
MTAYRARVRSRAPHPFAAPVVLFAGWVAGGCAGPAAPAGGVEHDPRVIVRSAPPAQPDPRRRSDETAVSAIAAIVDNRPIAWMELRPALVEAAGAVVLEEVILDRLLDAELAARSLSITPADIDAERQGLVTALTRDARADANDAERLIERLRRSRGLGESRFTAQLARTARLRRLVAGTVVVADEEVRAAHAMRHGPSFRTRVIVLSEEREAARLWSELNQVEEGLGVRFAEAAATRSRDPSASRGGLLGPISPGDPTFPGVVRRAIVTQAPGTLGPVLAVDNGYAILLVEERIDGDGAAFESVESGLRAELTRRRERLAMDELARRLLSRANITVIDPALRWSWEGRDAAR